VLKPAALSTEPEDLLRVAEQGKHAASDYWEDAVLAGVPAVGCRRCGGGLAGAPFVSTVHAGIRRLEGLSIDAVLLEGSGPTVPPVHADATILVVNAGEPSWSSVDYLGEVRVREADVIVMTMCEPPSATPDHVDHLLTRIRTVAPHVPIAQTVFRPEPVSSITGAAVYLASTSEESGSTRAVRHLEERHGCRVVGHTPNLSNRPALRRDLEQGLSRCDVLLTELKAASVETAVQMALERDKRVVFLHNRPVVVGGDYRGFADLAHSMWEKARGRWEAP
jgi:cyclic 2,3-diphosphoglycerate synthetase